MSHNNNNNFEEKYRVPKQSPNSHNDIEKEGAQLLLSN